MATYRVHMLDFGRPGEIREVEVDDAETGVELLLERIFFRGQNDVHPLGHPSVSVGDVIEIPAGLLVGAAEWV